MSEDNKSSIIEDEKAGTSIDQAVEEIMKGPNGNPKKAEELKEVARLLGCIANSDKLSDSI